MGDRCVALGLCGLTLLMSLACSDGGDAGPPPEEPAAGAPGQGGTGGDAGNTGGAPEGGLGGSGGADGKDESCEFEYRQGHGDLFVGFTDEASLKIFLRTDDGLRAPEGVCIFVPRERRELVEQLGGRPPGDAWDPIGVPEGEVFWHLPADPVAGVPWFGIASEGVHDGVLEGDELVLSIVEAELPQGAAFSSYETSAIGEPTFLFSTASDISSLTFPAEGHAHMSWTFSQPGEYRFTFTAAGSSLESGEALVSAPATFRFLIQD